MAVWGRSRGEKGHDGYGMKKAVLIVMKARHRDISLGNPVSLRVNDELTPGEQTAALQRVESCL